MDPSQDRPGGLGSQLRRVRPYLVLSLLGVVPIVTLVGVALVLSSRSLERLVHAGNDASVHITGAFVEREFEHWQATLSGYAGFPALSEAVARGDVDEVSRRLEIIVSTHQQVDRAFVTDTTGLLWSDFPVAPESRGDRFDHRDWFRGVKARMGPYVSEVYQRQAEPPLLVVAVATPVFDPVTGGTAGFLVIQVLPNGISNLLGRVEVGGDDIVLVLDHTGSVVAHPTLDLQARLYREYVDLLPGPGHTRGEVLRGTYDDPFTDVASFASAVDVPVGDHLWRVISQQPVAAALAPSHALRRQLAMAGLIFALLVCGLMWAVVRESVRRKEAEDALARMNRELERTVEARTAELREAEATLAQAQKLEAIGTLTGGITHDFNNLLTVISTNVTLLEASTSDQDRETRECIGDIQRAANQGAELIKRLLAFSRKGEVSPAPTRMDELVSELHRLLVRLLPSSIEIRCHVAPNVPSAMVDRTSLTQVILNLAINARDAMPDGGELVCTVSEHHVSEELATRYPGLPPGRYVRIEVADTGVGMNDEVRSRVFEPFFTTKEADGGTGLGLAVAYGIIQQHGGMIEVTGAPGQGTRFRILLPVAQVEEPSPSMEGVGDETRTVASPASNADAFLTRDT